MAEKITCICGREFYITKGKPCQCRRCGRAYSTDRLDPIDTAIRRLCGQPVGKAEKTHSDRPRDKEHNSSGQQTTKTPPSKFDPITAITQLIFGK
jgi:hypothetical protein